MCEPNESNYITCSLYAPSFKSHVILFVYIRHFWTNRFRFSDYPRTLSWRLVSDHVFGGITVWVMREHFRISSEVRGFVREVYGIQSKTSLVLRNIYFVYRQKVYSQLFDDCLFNYSQVNNDYESIHKHYFVITTYRESLD